MTARWLSAIVTLFFLAPIAAYAEISQPSEIRSYLSGRDDLASRRSSLMKRWDTLQQKISDQNAQCGQIAADSPLVDSCRSNQAAILSEIKNYKDELKQYEETLAKAENPSPHENLLLMQERLRRDLNEAKELRGKAMLQKSRLEAALAHGADPVITAGAPAGIERAEQTLTETERSIKELETKLGWTKRAIDNLSGAIKPDKDYDPVFDVGFGMVLQKGSNDNVKVLRPGHDHPIPLGDQFLPGDEIVTDKLNQARLSSLGSLHYVVTVGPETRLKLEQDHKTSGTIWKLSQGVIHSSPLVTGTALAPGKLRTPDSIIQGSPDSEYDVRINEKGETSIEVYRGRVEVQEPVKGVSYFVDSKTGGPNAVPWWVKDE